MEFKIQNWFFFLIDSLNDWCLKMLDALFVQHKLKVPIVELVE